MSGNWDGFSNEFITLSAGNTGAAGTGACTIAVLFRRSNTDATLLSLLSGTTVTREFVTSNGTLFGTNDFVGSSFAATINTWYVAAISKVAGTTKWRYHLWPYASDGSGTMQHAAGTDPSHDASDGSAITSIRIGYGGGSDKMRGDIAAVGMWNSALSDTQLNTLKSPGLQAWAALSPAALISLGGWNGTTGAVDLVGTCTQTGLTSTVTVGEDPPSFSYSVAVATTWPSASSAATAGSNVGSWVADGALSWPSASSSSASASTPGAWLTSTAVNGPATAVSTAASTPGAWTVTSGGGTGELTITVEAQAGNDPPRNQITVTGGSGATVTVTRTASDGAIVPLRGADPAALSGGEWIGFDYEMPYADAVTYTATDAGGNTAAITVDPLGVTQAWLVHPGVPSLSQPLYRITLGAIQDDTGATQHVILGRAAPITVTDGTRKAEQFTLGYRTIAAADETNMLALLRDTSTLLLQVVYPFTDASEYMWVQAGQAQRSRLTMQFGDARRTWSLACTVVDRPAGDLTAERQWADVLNENATWLDVMQKYDTWAGVLTGVAGT